MNFQKYFLPKNNMRLPQIIFLIGPSSAGKSTLAEIIKQEFPKYEIISDLDELKKLAEAELEKENKSQNKFKFFPSGGFDILDPKIWDDILILTAKKVLPEEFYIFEFSRGIDPKYLTILGISEEEVYERCFKLFFQTKPEIKIEDTLIIHVKCDFSNRLKRNRRRKKENKHFVAEKVMQNVYREDIFHYIHTGPNSGYFNEMMKILVYSIDNSKELILQDREKYFRIKIDEALSFYNSKVLSKVNNKKGGEIL